MPFIFYAKKLQHSCLTRSSMRPLMMRQPVNQLALNLRTSILPCYSCGCYLKKSKKRWDLAYNIKDLPIIEKFGGRMLKSLASWETPNITSIHIHQKLMSFYQGNIFFYVLDDRLRIRLTPVLENCNSKKFLNKENVLCRNVRNFKSYFYYPYILLKRSTPNATLAFKILRFLSLN